MRWASTHIRISNKDAESIFKERYTVLAIESDASGCRDSKMQLVEI